MRFREWRSLFCFAGDAGHISLLVSEENDSSDELIFPNRILHDSCHWASAHVASAHSSPPEPLNLKVNKYGRSTSQERKLVGVLEG